MRLSLTVTPQAAFARGQAGRRSEIPSLGPGDQRLLRLAIHGSEAGGDLPQPLPVGTWRPVPGPRGGSWFPQGKGAFVSRPFQSAGVEHHTSATRVLLPKDDEANSSHTRKLPIVCKDRSASSLVGVHNFSYVTWPELTFPVLFIPPFLYATNRRSCYVPGT